MPSEHPQHPGGFPHGLEFFYVPPGDIAGGEARIEGEEFAHLTHVMRHREGDTIAIVDGAGTAYVATITGIRKQNAVCSLLATHPGFREPPRHVTLAVGVLKNPSRFETMVEKSTELGVRKIIPLLTARTIPRHARVERWQSIALAGMKQCGGALLPEIAPLTVFQEVIETARGERVMLHELASEPCEHYAAATGPSEYTVCIGPEGGFTDAEVASALQHAWKVVSVGNRRLRSETAAIVAAVRLLA